MVQSLGLGLSIFGGEGFRVLKLADKELASRMYRQQRTMERQQELTKIPWCVPLKRPTMWEHSGEGSYSEIPMSLLEVLMLSPRRYRVALCVLIRSVALVAKIHGRR